MRNLLQSNCWISDYEEMIGFLNCQDKSQIKKVFLVHGDYDAQQFYKTKLEEKGYTNISIPEMGDEEEI